MGPIKGGHAEVGDVPRVMRPAVPSPYAYQASEKPVNEAIVESVACRPREHIIDAVSVGV
jgi:hypothetical protein